MASSITEDIQRDEVEGSQNRYITSFHSVEASECATALVNTDAYIKENQEPGASDQYFTAPSSSSWYCSARIQGMIEKRGDFSSELEFSIESSRVHHSEVDTTTMSQTESSSGKTNRECFELLKRRKYVRKGDRIVSKQYDEKLVPSLFEEWDDLVVGEKIAEGGQAEIYEASAHGINHVLKVFKAGGLLQDIEKQFSPALLKYYQFESNDRHRTPLPGCIYKATLLKDERLFDRFALVMWRCWGDLRKLIDFQMMQSHNRGPPFTPKQVVGLMYQIADQMNQLHGQHPPILHKDLKAANVLVKDTTIEDQRLSEAGRHVVSVIDFECSLGVVGTRFWRAPEILKQLKNRVPSLEVVFTDKCDVYSYGMTCYELVTGRIPFEGSPLSKYDMVLNGDRPELPIDSEPLVKEIIISCWHSIPSNRPSFDEIVKKLYDMKEHEE